MEIEMSGAPGSIRTTSREDGSFEFQDLTAGIYQLVVRDERDTLLWRDTLPVSAGTAQMVISLERRGHSQGSLETVSTSRLREKATASVP
jgi:hypothetical protein